MIATSKRGMPGIAFAFADASAEEVPRCPPDRAGYLVGQSPWRLRRECMFGAATALVTKVRQGGKGVFGPVPMPPNPPEKISDADLSAVIAWILGT